MKRLSLLAILMALALAGCHKAAPGTARDTPENTGSDSRANAAPPPAFKPETGSLVSSDQVPLLEQINRENIRVVAAAMPGIVRITAGRQADPRMKLFGSEIPFHLPFGSGPSHEYPPNSPSYGSGVVISKDGYIVTNEHVIEYAKDIEVQIPDKGSFPARVAASDTLLDVTVLKIDATDLAALPWGDSDKVQVGEQVFAIGNPFDLDDSVSKGIVSAMRRTLPELPGASADEVSHFENFIQTDAAINPGNSGGALINIHGELIGINTAIASTSRGNMGVGFAIPSNLVRYAVEGLLKQGRLVRGFLGVELPETIDDGVTAQLNLGTQRGALLAGVLAKSPADLAGLLPNDYITQVDGHPISGGADLRLIVSQLPIGKEVVLDYIRDGKPRTTTVKIIEVPPGVPGAESTDKGGGNPKVPDADNGQPENENVLNGLQVSDLNDKSRQKFNVDPGVTTGVVVSGVQDNSPADDKSVQPGDVIESACVNRGTTRQLTGAKDFADMARDLKPDQSVVLLMRRGKVSCFIYLAPQK